MYLILVHFLNKRLLIKNGSKIPLQQGLSLSKDKIGKHILTALVCDKEHAKVRGKIGKYNIIVKNSDVIKF